MATCRTAVALKLTTDGRDNPVNRHLGHATVTYFVTSVERYNAARSVSRQGSCV